MSTHLIDGIVKALATLAAHNIIPGSLEVTRATYQQLRLSAVIRIPTRRSIRITLWVFG
jgi:hypothetical protein